MDTVFELDWKSKSIKDKEYTIDNHAFKIKKLNVLDCSTPFFFQFAMHLKHRLS